jgi:hypothetical protein
MSVRLVPPNVIERFMSPPHVIDAAEAAKRDRQIADAIRLLAPKQVDECRTQLKAALDIMADAHRRDTRPRAHRVGSAVENAYRRTDLVIKRRKLMEAWARYCCTPQTVTGEVMPLKKEVSA